MTTQTLPQRYTIADVGPLPDPTRYELVDGQLAEKHTGTFSVDVANTILAALLFWLRDNPIGRVWMEAPFAFYSADNQRFRRPAVAFVSRERLPVVLDDSVFRVAPDLAIEVISPTDVASETETKLEEYLANGVRLVWIVYPETRTIHVYPAGEAPARLHANDTLAGGAVLPGFTLDLSTIWPGTQD